MTTPDEPLVAAYRFLDAVERGDEAGARAAATDRGFGDPGDSALRYWNNARRKGLVGDPGRASVTMGDRAVVEVTVGRPIGDLPPLLNPSGRRRIRMTHQLWLLLLRTPAGWRVEGAAKPKATAGLFLAGAVSGVPQWSDLPFSTEAAALATAMVAALTQRSTVAVDALEDTDDSFSRLGARTLRVDISRFSGGAEVLGAVEVPALRRLLIGLAFRVGAGNDRVEHWIILDRAGASGRPVLRWVNTYPSLEGLLAEHSPTAGRTS